MSGVAWYRRAAMKIATWNVNGIRAREAQVYDCLQTDAPDVLCLQELKASPHQVPLSLLDVAGYWPYWHGNKGYSGVALLVSKKSCPTRPAFSHPSFDHENRIVVVELGSLLVASIYVPNGGKSFEAKIRFLEAMNVYVAEQLALGKSLVLCGDLNVAREPRDVHEKLRDDSQMGQTAQERDLIEGILKHGLRDEGRFFAPEDDALFTWWAPWRQYRERNIGWRLDYVLTSEACSKRTRSCTANRLFGTSDHGPVTATFDGPLFDASAVVEGSAQSIEPSNVTAPSLDVAPQLDLFGNPKS